MSSTMDIIRPYARIHVLLTKYDIYDILYFGKGYTLSATPKGGLYYDRFYRIDNSSDSMYYMDKNVALYCE